MSFVLVSSNQILSNYQYFNVKSRLKYYLWVAWLQCILVNLFWSRLMRQGKGSYQKRNYSTFQCDNIVFMISNYLLYSSVESIRINHEANKQWTTPSFDISYPCILTKLQTKYLGISSSTDTNLNLHIDIIAAANTDTILPKFDKRKYVTFLKIWSFIYRWKAGNKLYPTG